MYAIRSYYDSSITEVKQMELFVEEPLSDYKQVVRSNEDVLTSILENKSHLPPLRFDCGSEDLLIEFNRTLHQELLNHGIDHVYQEYPGGHQWEYWQEHLVDTLQFFDKAI